MPPTRRMSDILPQLMNPIFGRKSALFGKMLANWALIVGDETAQKAMPLELKFSRSKNKEEDEVKGKNAQAILTLAVKPAFALEMSYQKLLLMEKVNVFFGYQAIKDIRLVQNSEIMNKKTGSRPLPRPLTLTEQQRIETLCEKVQENDLQTALKNLGKAILSRKSHKS